MIAEVLRIAAPVLLLVATGIWIGRVRRMDVATLTSFAFFALVPAIVFRAIVRADFESATTVWMIVGLVLVQFVIMGAFGFAFGSLRPVRAHRRVIVLAALLSNIGNLGLPLLVLFTPADVVAGGAVVLVVQALLTFIVGIPLLSRSNEPIGKRIVGILRYPVVVAIALGLFVRATTVIVPQWLMQPIDLFGAALPAVALATVGIQLAGTRRSRTIAATVGVTILLRNVISPGVAFALARLVGADASMTTLLVVTAALPVAVNVHVLATEFDTQADVAASIVVGSTVVSLVTLPILIALLT